MSYQRRRHRLSTGAIILAVTATLTGCDLLEGPGFGRGARPQLTAFSVTQSTVAEGDTLEFIIEAEDDAGVDRIRLELSGAFTKDTTFAAGSQGTAIVDTGLVVVPGGTPAPELMAVATVYDNADSASVKDTVFATIQDATAPAVSASPSPGSVGSGQTIRINVTASDNRGLASLRLDVTNGSTYDTVLVDTLASPTTSYSQTWELVAPDIQVSTLQFIPSVVDINNLEGVGDSAFVEIGDRSGPEFISLTTLPDSTIPLGDSLQVTVELRDPAGIKQVTFIGLAYRGDPQAGTDSVVERFAQKTITFPRPTEADTLPKRYTLYPYLLPTDNETTEPVEIFVVAEDSVGNVSDTTKAMYVGGPDVTITYPPEDFAVGVGSDFNVRVALDDGTGVDSAKLYVVGSSIDQALDLTGSFPTRTDTPFVVSQSVTMPGSEQVVTLQAVAWNTAEVQGQSRRLEVDILAQAPSDTTPPVVSVTAQRLTPSSSGARMELLDELRITVSAFDGNAGLERLGLQIIATRGTEQDTVTEDVTGLAGSKSLEELVFQVPVDSLYSLFNVTGPAVLDSVLPENLDLRIHGFAADTVGEFACSVGSEEQRDCEPATYSSTEFYEAADTAGLLLRVEAVRGITVLLDNTDAVIADLAVDTVDDRLFLSNVTENLVELLQLTTDPRSLAFQNPVQVGSEPLGLFIGERVVGADDVTFGVNATAGDTARTLLVANSGGTNMSLVHLATTLAEVEEVDRIRLRTPNSYLLELLESEDDNGNTQYTGTWIDVADRPQFLAQDSLLRVVYSTRSTAVSSITTVRFIHVDPDPTSDTDVPEVQFLITDAMVDPDNPSSLALANVDSLEIVPVSNGGDLVQVYMHKPGYPSQVIESPFVDSIGSAIDDLTFQIDTIMTNRGAPELAPLFYPFLMRGSWDLDAFSWEDTTFISASGDRGKIAVGEGASQPTGRIMIWHGDQLPTYSDAISIEDLTNNAAEVVLGVGLNVDGSLGVARGNATTYFFTPDLRLQGLYRQEDEGGAGATFHPTHDDLNDGGHTDTDGDGVAFTGTSEHSIDVVNTFHFNQVNKLVIRDNVIGPLRAGPPLAGDNTGLTCPTDKDCIVAKLYGITSAGGVVIVNVRRRDLEPYATP